LLDEAAAVIESSAPPGRAIEAPLRVGVDLGTATMVLLVLDDGGHPLAGRMEPARVVRDGLVVDFIGAVDRLRAMKATVEADLGLELTAAASGFPPGVPIPERQAIAHVVQSAGMACTDLIGEPTAANMVLRLHDGAIVDVGGGTTGIAILQDGQVAYTADEATGGTHFDLVIAGAFDLELEEATRLKETAAEQERLLTVVRPVIEKIATIIGRHIDGWDVDQVTLVGGACAFPGMAAVISDRLGIPAAVAPHTQLVTPLGIALGAPVETGTILNRAFTNWSHG
jgi:ethanolamine utilization protein EutJ